MLPTWQVDGQSCLIVGVSGDHSMAGQRRRTTHAATFEERMAEEARRFREAAKDLAVAARPAGGDGIPYHQLAPVSRPTTATGAGRMD